MVVEAESYLSLPLSHLKDLVAECASFQAWCGVDTAAEAKERIYFFMAPRDAVRPFAVVDMGSDWEDNLIADGAVFLDKGQLTLGLVDDVDVEESEPDQLMAFTNRVGSVFEDIRMLAGVDGRLNVTRIGKLSGPTLGDDVEVNGATGVSEVVGASYVEMSFELDWQS